MRRIQRRHWQPVLVPGWQVIQAFNGAMWWFLVQGAAATIESATATLRDTLLPHLMSGRLTVRDAEARVEAAL
ncbi:MAG: type I restriction endonuclease subunit S [Propionibacteriaceae bacterium]|nr:type I restriction endonuclease subunit S [Propionibacteriaceae bacterium]